jgi:hypothetical protein
MQDANTSDMIFSVAETIALLADVLTLEPGDVIVMGTPAGVGQARTPPVWMKAGDTIEIEIERVGLLVQPDRRTRRMSVCRRRLRRRGRRLRPGRRGRRRAARAGGPARLRLRPLRDVYEIPRAIALDHEIMRVFQQLGLADAVAPHCEPFTPSEYYGVDGQLIRA